MPRVHDAHAIDRGGQRSWTLPVGRLGNEESWRDNRDGPCGPVPNAVPALGGTAPGQCGALSGRESTAPGAAPIASSTATVQCGYLLPQCNCSRSYASSYILSRGIGFLIRGCKPCTHFPRSARD